MITVSTVTLDGDFDGVIPVTESKARADKFSANRVHHVVEGVGLNLP